MQQPYFTKKNVLFIFIMHS